MTRRRATVLLVQTLFGAVLLIAWLRVVDLEEVGQALGQARWGLVAVAAGLSVLSTFLRSLRWRLVLHPVAQPPFLDLVMIVLAANLVNFVVPLRTGEVARSVFLKQRQGTSVAASLATIAIDRAFDLAAVLLLGACGALLLGGLQGRALAFLVVGAILILAFGVFASLAIWARQKQVALLARFLPSGINLALRERILGSATRFLDGFSALGSRPRILAPLLALSIAAILIDSSAFFVLLLSLGAGASPILVIMGYSLYVLTFLIPAAPGYVGTAEAFGSLVFVGIGLPVDVASSAVLLSHATNAVLVLALGVIGFAGIGLRPAAAVRAVLGEKGDGKLGGTEAPAQPGP